MPVFFVLGVGLAAITAMAIATHVAFYGSKRDVVTLFIIALVIVIILWAVQI
jgi:hypothetical protein